MTAAADAFGDWQGAPLSREFAHQARRLRASRMRNVGRGLVIDGRAEEQVVILADCRGRGFRMALFSSDPIWRAWA